MGQKAFYFDSTRCIGCKTCELACKDYKNLSADVPFRRVFDYEGGDWAQNSDGTYASTVWQYHLSMACNHCNSPACLENCPKDAITKDEDTGLVRVDSSKCNGCGQCVQACPYGVPQIDPDTDVMVKCDGCYKRVIAGKLPVCVESCPMRALDFGDLETLTATYGTDGPIAPMPESATVPSVIIKPCSCAKPVGDTTGQIGNVSEVTTASSE